VYQLTAAAVLDTINITERAGRAAALLIVIHYVTGFGARQFEHGLPLAEPVARQLCMGNDGQSDCPWPPSSPRHELRSSRPAVRSLTGHGSPVAGRVTPAHVFGVLGTACSWFGQMPNPSHPSLMGTGKREPAAARCAQRRAAG